ncbi:PKD domain-containing protein [Zobellia laminariae]|uniref:PKD domain-containing protein n=1 Tax=Zobellia laminariae TaxID=248906 RepID=UPI0026F452EC|nr:PKD domain-containing protein [Zobellia laminariae]WKX76451.1 PKD domain-containing protein [Zobellia laminariae]
MTSFLITCLTIFFFGNFRAEAQLPDDFQLNELASGFTNATSISFSPDGRIFVLDRFGEILIHKPDLFTTVSAGTIPVYHEFEDGLLAMAFDPNFTTNNYIYVYYSVIGTAVNRISRFTMSGDSILLPSELNMLEWPVQRTNSFHAGGDMGFDSQGNLYISTGDNSNHGAYAAVDEIDSDDSAEKSSSNTNDYRGKILRITPQANGTYTIPTGNLFPVGTPKTKPEIYVMGTRNPYRIFIDKENNDWLFWGDVGPDAVASGDEGPRGYDEINLAKSSGNFGWPYFSGTTNEAYEISYATPKYNTAAAPKNSSVWNTGIIDLPPAKEALLAFPNKSYFAGPRYKFDSALTDQQRLPSVFDGIFFYYDFNFSVIYAAQLDLDGNVSSIEQLAPDVFPTGGKDGYIDMEIGPDGHLYILEYGVGCCADGDGSGKLVRVDYTGIVTNSPPIVEVEADVTDGPLNLIVQFNSDGTYDPDGDTNLLYEWDFNGDKIVDSNLPNPSYTYTTKNIFSAQLKVTDGDGALGAKTIIIYAGNSKADFIFNSPLDGGLVGWGDDINIDLEVTDAEDGSTSDSGIDCSDVNIIPSLGHIGHFHDSATLDGCPDDYTLAYEGHDIDGDMDIFYVLGSNYTDKDGLKSFGQIQLHPKRKEAEFFDQQNGTEVIGNTDSLEGGFSAIRVDNNSYIVFEGRNLSNISAVKYRLASSSAGGVIELHTGSTTGPIVATSTVPNTGNLSVWEDVVTNITDPGGKNDLYFVFKNTTKPQDSFDLNYVEFIGDGVSIDRTPPLVNSVKASSETEVIVEFSEYVLSATAQQTGNYTIDNGVSVLSAQLQSDNRTVILTTSAIASGVSHNLNVSNVQNESGLSIVNESFSFSTISSVRVNSGGLQTTWGGQIFSEDNFSSGGTVFTNERPIDGTLDDTLYQTERFGNFSYEIPVVSNGEYDIRLHFAELYFGVENTPGGIGSRIFNVTIEGTPVLTNFDILAEVPAATALQKEINNVSVTDGFVSISFTSIANNPKISGIEVLPPDTFVGLENQPKITITSPSNGWDVNQPFEVAFAVENWIINEDDTHVHYFIDDMLIDKYYGYDPIPIDGLSQGEHIVKIELYNANHTGTGIYDEVTVNVTGLITCNETPFPESWSVKQLESESLPYPSVYTFAKYDFDGDGLKDIVTGSWWYKNPGSVSGDWVRNDIGENFGNVVHVYDFDDDGNYDLLGTALGVAPDNLYESEVLLWAKGDGEGNFTIFNNIPAGNTGYSEPFVAGLAGGVFSTGGPYQMAINWNGAESTEAPVQMLTPSSNPTQGAWSLVDISQEGESSGEDIQAGDIDRDGDLDLFQGINWLRNNGNGDFEIFDTGITYVSTPDRAQLADFDRDGDLDAVVGQLGFGGTGNNQEISWFEAPSDPTQPWVRHILDEGISGSLSVFAVDIDFDGDQDIVVGEWRGEHRLVIFENDLCGSGNFNLKVIDDGGPLEHHDGARTVDIDNDGDLDIISNGWRNDNRPRIYENTTVRPQDDRPIADAGEDRTILIGETLILKGQANDPDGGDIVTYQWSKESGPNATLSNENTLNLTVNGLIEGVYVFKLGVIDDEGDTTYDDVTITVVQENGLLAVAEATPTAGSAPLEVTFIGSNSIGNIESYFWDFKNGNTSTDADAMNTFAESGTYEVVLTITDSSGNTQSDTIVITVSETTEGAPTVDAGGNQMITLPTNTIVLSGSGSDFDGGTVTFAWTKESGSDTATLSGEDTAELTVSNMEAGVYNFLLTVTDDEEKTASDDVRVTVVPENGLLAVAEATPTEGSAPLEVTFTGSNSIGDIESYLWDFKDGNTSTDADTSKTFIENGTYEVELRVTDAGGNTHTDIVIITVSDKMGYILEKNPIREGVAVIRILNQPEDFMMLGVNLHDQQGRLISGINAEDIEIGQVENSYEIPVHLLQNGIYFLNIANNRGKPVTMKILVQN